MTSKASKPSDTSGPDFLFRLRFRLAGGTVAIRAWAPEQLAWVDAWAEHLDCEKQARYCDPETGEVRRAS